MNLKKPAILSISLLTILMNAAIVPLLSQVSAAFYEGEERKKAIGASFFAANLSAMVLPLIGATLAETNWRYAFVVYGVALLVLVFTALFIPNREKLQRNSEFRLFYVSRTVLLAASGYFFVTMLFLSLPSNISVFLESENIGTPSTVAWINSSSTMVSMFVSLSFARIYSIFKDRIFSVGLLLCGLGFATIAFSHGLPAVLLGKVLIGSTMGMLHPFFSYKVTQSTPKEHATSALSLVNSGFRMGTFVSPLFFFGANSLLGITTIRGEFTLVSMVLLGAMVVFTFLFQYSRKKAPEKAL